MLGGELYDQQYKMMYAEGSGAPTDDFADLNQTLTDEGKRKIDSEHWENVLHHISVVLIMTTKANIFSLLYSVETVTLLYWITVGAFPWRIRRMDFR